MVKGYEVWTVYSARIEVPPPVWSVLCRRFAFVLVVVWWLAWMLAEDGLSWFATLTFALLFVAALVLARLSRLANEQQVQTFRATAEREWRQAAGETVLRGLSAAAVKYPTPRRFGGHIAAQTGAGSDPVLRFAATATEYGVDYVTDDVDFFDDAGIVIGLLGLAYKAGKAVVNDLVNGPPSPVERERRRRAAEAERLRRETAIRRANGLLENLERCYVAELESIWPQKPAWRPSRRRASVDAQRLAEYKLSLTRAMLSDIKPRLPLTPVGKVLA